MTARNVLVTGPYGEAGEAILEHLYGREEYEFTFLNRSDHPEYETHVADVADYDAIRPAFDGQDAVVHLAAQSDAGAGLEEIVDPNIVGTDNVLRAMDDAGVEKLVYASSQRVMGLYEEDHAPALYEEDYPLTLDHESLPMPDGYYGASKEFGEHLCRLAVRRNTSVEQAYSLRISSVRTAEYDHPYGDAERGVDRGEEDVLTEDDEVWDQSQTGSWERDSERYQEMVDRLKATWTSQRDFAHLIECCLRDETVSYDVFYAVSDNAARWFDTDHAKAVLGYDPQDDAAEWNAPPNVDDASDA